MATLLEDTFDAQSFTNVDLASISNSGGETTVDAAGGGNRVYYAYRDLSTTSATWELYCEFKFGADEGDAYLGMIQSGGGNGYLWRFQDWANNAQLRRYQAGLWWNNPALLVEPALADVGSGEQVYVRLKYDGNYIYTRFWKGSDPEPGTWNDQTAESTLTGAFDQVAIGTQGGATAKFQYLLVSDLAAATPPDVVPDPSPDVAIMVSDY